MVCFLQAVTVHVFFVQIRLQLLRILNTKTLSLKLFSCFNTFPSLFCYMDTLFFSLHKSQLWLEAGKIHGRHSSILGRGHKIKKIVLIHACFIFIKNKYEIKFNMEIFFFDWLYWWLTLILHTLNKFLFSY